MEPGPDRGVYTGEALPVVERMNQKTPVAASEHLAAEVQTLEPDQTVQTAAQMMAELDADALLVDSPLGVQGILTDRDILVRVVAAGRDPAATLVREVMSSQVVTCPSDASLEEVLGDMASRQIRRMPVIGPDGALAGLLTIEKYDLAGAMPAGPDDNPPSAE